MPFATVDDYIAAQPAKMRNALARVRRAIRKAVPAVTETMAYNMPAYRSGNRRLLYFAAWKEHYALYVATKPLLAAFEKQMRGCKIDKGTIRFSLANPVPERLIVQIAKFRAQQHVGG